VGVKGGILNLFQLLLELLGRKFYFPDDFTNEGTGEVSAGVIGHGGGSAVGVAVEYVAPFLSDRLKAEGE